MPSESSKDTPTARNEHNTVPGRSKLLTAHRAAGIPEVLLHFFDHLPPDELRCAAQVCKTWSPWALDVLWGHRLIPLSALLSKLSWLMDNHDPRAVYCLSIGDSLIPDFEAWTSFLRQYAHKVTRLDIDAILNQVAQDFMLKLLKATGTTLCPKLHTVIVASGHLPISRCPTVSLLVGSPLRDVTFGETCCSDDLHVLPKLLVQISPKIQSLTLEPCDDPPPPYALSLKSFHELRVAHLQDISFRTWSSLCGCPFLEEVTVLDCSTDTCGAKGRSLLHFPSLHTLTISSQEICSDVLASTVMPNLRTLDASILRDNSERICGQLVERSQHLKEVKISFGSSVLTNRTIEAFAPLPELRRLELEGWADTITVTDSALILLARSHPQLRVLSIDVVGGDDSEDPCPLPPNDEKHDAVPRPTHLTTESLLAIVEHCRVLTHLAVPLDLISFDSPNLPAPSLSVTTLGVRHLHPRDLRHFMSILVAWFPNVTTFAVTECPLVDEEALVKEFWTRQVDNQGELESSSFGS
ncbi:hypothetical protein FRB94_001381 [Tulasnella sp. JGI-2019a]|nr:hypothetical protein FRB93_013533 [Tulasnella sp. JGI-2019a]KAG9005597.1 hypothetical protein FRB94_001381 [Tulasnella sp. JGI-2019a]KAG9034487.1 hypothetical protein FRB95_013163 [Tulasnella sp. JGI-2019a]